MSAEEVTLAIRATLTGNPEANKFLMAFAETAACWEISLQLLSSSADAGIQFYAANLLYMKVQKQWGTISESAQSSLGRQLFLLFDALCDSTAPVETVVVERFCLLLSIVCAKHHDAENVGFLASRTLERAQAASQRGEWNALMVCLSMAAALGESSTRSDFGRRNQEELDRQLEQAQPAFLQLFAFCYVEADSAPAGFSLRRRSAQALRSWSGRGVTLGDVEQLMPSLLDFMLAALQAPGALVGRDAAGDAAVGDASAAQSFLAAAAESADTLSAFLRVREVPRRAARERAALKVVEAASKMEGALCVSALMGDDDGSHKLMTFLTTVVSQELSTVVRGDASALRLVGLLLDCARDPRVQLGSLVLDSWLELQDIPVAERHPFMGAELYKGVLHATLHQLAYPAAPRPSGADGGAAPSALRAAFAALERSEGVVDEDALLQLREGPSGACDVLITCYYVLRADFFSEGMRFCRERGMAWQAAEAVLFAASAVSKECGAWLRRREKRARSNSLPARNAAAPPLTPREVRDMDRTLEHVLRLLSGVLGAGLSLPPPAGDASAALLLNATAHPLMLKQSCRLLGAYHALLLREPANCGLCMLLPALRFLVAAVRHAPAAESAARALRMVCAGCAEEICADSGALEVIAGALPELPAAMAGQRAEDAEAALLQVVEAVTRVAAAMGNTAAASALLARLLEPAADALRGAPEPQAAACALRLVAQFVRFCDAPSGGGGATYAVAPLEGLWPLLNGACESLAAHDEVLEALCEVYSKVLLSLRGVAQALLESILDRSVRLFESRSLCAALKPLGTAMEVFGADEAYLEGFANLLAGVVASATRAVDSNSVRDLALLRELFRLLHRAAVFCPRAVAADAATLARAMYLAAGLIATPNPEREATRFALQFLRALVSCSRPKGAAPQLAATAYEAIAQNAQALVAAMLQAVAGQAPTILHHSFIDGLYEVLQRVFEGNAADATAMLAASLRELRMEGMERLHGVMVRILDRGNKQRFKQLMTHFSRVCNGELSAQDWLEDFDTSDVIVL